MPKRSQAKREKHYPSVIYVAYHDDGGVKYLTADPTPEALVMMGERVKLARYTFADIVQAEGHVKLRQD